LEFGPLKHSRTPEPAPLTTPERLQESKKLTSKREEKEKKSYTTENKAARSSVVVKELYYKSEVRGFDTR
jgi:hypothetical protein